MSTRPATASFCGVNVVETPPCRMNEPSCTLRTRSTLGLNVIVSVITETREALLIEIGTVYGPPATWKVVPGTVRMICAGVGAGVPPGGGVCGTSVSLGCPAGAAGAAAPVAGAAGGVVTGGTPGGAAPGGTGGAGFSGIGAIGVGTGEVPGGA